MITSQQTPFLSEILEGVEIPPGKLAYFRGRLRNRLYDLVIREFLHQEKTKNLTRADLARRIGRNPAQITRWFSTPSNWTIDTISDLMIAMAVEPNFSVGSLVEEEASDLRSEEREELFQGFAPKEPPLIVVKDTSRISNTDEAYLLDQLKDEPHAAA